MFRSRSRPRAKPWRPVATLVIGAACAGSGAGCGAGSAAIVASSGDSGGGNGLAAVTAFRVENAKTSPADVVFVLRDDEGDPAQVTLVYELPDGSQHDLTALRGDLVENPVMLDSSSAGIEYRASWFFEQETGIPDDGSFFDGVTVFTTLASGVQELIQGANADLVGLGNDAPLVRDVTPPNAPQVDGVVPIEFTVEDTSADVIRIRVEFDIANDDPDAGWQPARPSPLDATPEYAIEGVVGAPDGTNLVFFWDTDVDLNNLEDDVLLRFTPDDGVAAGATVLSPGFRVDNNREPVVFLDDGLLVSNDDERRGIPIPFTLQDEESDEVQLVFQWRRPGEDFPDLLDLTPAEIAAILADPEARRENRVCSEFTRSFTGRILPANAISVRLPELASESTQLLAPGLLGRALDVLRPVEAIEATAKSWPTNPLRRPRGAVPVADGIRALVLDEPTDGAWRLAEIDLATGEIVAVIATETGGSPDALAWEPGRSGVLVASHSADVWRVDRVVIETGAVERLVSADGSTEGGALRAVAVLGTGSALVTAGSSLIRLDYADPLEPRRSTLFDDLATPWGVALDPLQPGAAYVAERTAPVGPGEGRVLRVELDTLSRTPVHALTETGSVPAFPRPAAIALERGGSRLLVGVELVAGQHVLRAVDLGGALANRVFLDEPLPGRPSSLTTGPDNLRLFAVPDGDTLAVGGGVEQRRRIANAAVGPLVRVDRPFAPPITSDRRWRILGGLDPAFGDPSGRKGMFVWNSEEVPGQDVFLRAIPVDSEVGLADETGAPKRVSNPLDGPVIELGSPALTDIPRSVALADLDGDGDLDLACASSASNTLTVFFQDAPGMYDPVPLELGGAGVTPGPYAVVAADLDGDGDLDLASANGTGVTLAVFFQTAPGIFDPVPLKLGGANVTVAPRSLAAADIDGDGNQDLVSGNANGDTLTIFFQQGSGAFDPAPLELGGPGVTDSPQSVVAADLDGDGDLDVASANRNDHRLTVFFQESAGVFDPVPLVVGGQGVTDNPRSVAAADLDGDGDLDLASANADTLSVFFQESPGSFGGQPIVLGNPAVTDFPLALVIADVDGDGDPDLVSANALSDSLTVFFQESPGVYDPIPFELGGPDVTRFPRSVAAGDVDGDGDLDLASANGNSDTLTVFLRKSLGTFDLSPLVLGDSEDIDLPYSAVAADIDGDGDLDLVGAGGQSDVLAVFFQESPGVFDPDPLRIGSSAVFDAPRSVVAADLDGDGDLDIASANELGNTLTVFFQEESGEFDPVPLVLGGPFVTGFPGGLVAADLDGDGDLDLVSANRTSDSLTVFFQSSPGAFDPRPLELGDASVTDLPNAVAAADLDGDGDLDIVSANQGSHTLTAFVQQAPGLFDPRPLVLGNIAVTEAPLALTVSDLDGDGDMDLASANANTLSVFLQEGPLSFSPQPIVLGNPAVTSAPHHLAVGDVDGDGDADLVSANTMGDSLTVFFQLAPGIFDSSPLELGSSEVTRRPYAVVVADLDGDGDPELISANGNSDSLTVFWGGR